jgi:lipopolysaccharide/colanic/teichoic acid biosynthesis glycosyltransferase
VSAAPQQDVRSITQLADAELISLTPRHGELVSVGPTAGDAAAALSVAATADPAVAVVAAPGVGRPLTGELLRAGVKRALDIVGAALALLILAPLFAVIAVLIVLDSPGPVFYRAERVGFGGRPLRMLKFRKMHPDATGGLLTVANDARLTRVGARLVRAKLDELPQLWHVLRGDMSLVGPRPECPDYVERFAADYRLILNVRPGITGFTQLAFACEGRILDPLDPCGHYVQALLPQKVLLDRLYASRPSLRRDVEILIATLATVVLRVPVAVNRASGALTLRRRPARRHGGGAW